MKTKLQLAALALALSTLNAELSTCHAQGSFTPPAGTPAPVMKSLDQIEARTAITNRTSLVTISQPGSYYLTGNLTVSSGDGIVISTNGVTLDLNGFTIRSTAASATGTGIGFLNNLRDVAIFNGHIRGGVTNNGAGIYSGSGFVAGINIDGSGAINVRLSHISVSGCLNSGIYLQSGDSTVVEACMVRTVGVFGIVATVIKNCVALDCGFTAIAGDQVSDSHGEASSNGNGVYATTAQNSYGSSISGKGIVTVTANNCVGYRPGGTAIQATVANGCYATAGTNLITYKYNMP